MKTWWPNRAMFTLRLLNGMAHSLKTTDVGGSAVWQGWKTWGNVQRLLDEMFWKWKWDQMYRFICVASLGSDSRLLVRDHTSWIESMGHLEVDYMSLKLGSFWIPHSNLVSEYLECGSFEIVISSWNSLKWSIELWMILIPPPFFQTWIILNPIVFETWVTLNPIVFETWIILNPIVFETWSILNPIFFLNLDYFESDFFWNMDHCQSGFWIETWIMLNPVFDIWNLVFWLHVTFLKPYFCLNSVSLILLYQWIRH